MEKELLSIVETLKGFKYLKDKLLFHDVSFLLSIFWRTKDQINANDLKICSTIKDEWFQSKYTAVGSAKYGQWS